jgi:hypothetical protein
MDQSASKGNGQFQDCSAACPTCCSQETTERLTQIQGDLTIRNKALVLSAVLIVMIFGAEIWYSFLHPGQELNLPHMDIIWTMVCAPWFGVAGSKIAQMVIDRRLK